MILEIAVGIVLGFLLLGLIPIVVIGSLAALRWLLPLGMVGIAAIAVAAYPTQFTGTVGVLAALLALLAAWLLVPGKLAMANNRVAQALANAHQVYMSVLDKRPPYDGVWWPIRWGATLVAIVVTSALETAALVALSVVWR